jgi:hypothetical protein
LETVDQLNTQKGKLRIIAMQSKEDIIMIAATEQVRFSSGNFKLSRYVIDKNRKQRGENLRSPIV